MKTKHHVLALALVALAGAAFEARAADALSPKDTEFVNKAAAAGMAEVDQGKVAKQRGGDRVRGFAATMVADHGKANDKLKALAQSNGWTLPSGPDAKAKEQLASLEAKTGAEFDQAYASAMQKDHDEAVALFKDASEHADNADLRQFARNTLPTLEHHKQMAYDLKPAKR